MKWLIVIQGVAGILLGLCSCWRLASAPRPCSVPCHLLAGERDHRPGVAGLGPHPWGGRSLVDPRDHRRHRRARHPCTPRPGYQTLVDLHGHPGPGVRGDEPGPRLQAGGGWGIGPAGRAGHHHRPVPVVNPLAGAIALPVVLGAFILVGGIASIFMACGGLTLAEERRRHMAHPTAPPQGDAASLSQRSRLDRWTSRVFCPARS